MTAQRRIVVFVNPHGGKRRALPVLERIKPVLAEAGIEPDVRVTQHPGHAAEIARTLDVVVVRRAGRWQMLRLFTKVFDGSHVSLDYVEYHQVRSFAIDCPDPHLLDLDGEMKGRTPLSVDVLPSALQIFG